MMARYRQRGMALRPVQRIKHVVDLSSTLAAATQLNNTVIAATDTPTLGVSNSVITGSKIYGIYLKVEVVSNEDEVPGAIPNCYMIVMKSPGNNITPPAANAVGISDDKRFVIHQEMIMLQNVNGGNPRVLFNGVIKIPRGLSRFGPADNLYVGILAPVVDIALCIQVHYKEFR